MLLGYIAEVLMRDVSWDVGYKVGGGI